MTDLFSFSSEDVPKPRTDEELHSENEFLLSRIREEFGAEEIHFGSDCPPEVRNEFLNSIIQFEAGFNREIPQITVFERIGSPHFIDSKYLTDEGVEAEYNRLQELLFDNNLVLESIYEKGPRILYRFLTEELFQHEIDNLQGGGFYTHFCYEEFHPNAEEDLKEYTAEFINEIINQNMPAEFNHLNQAVMSKAGIVLTAQQAHSKIEAFYNDFHSLVLHNLSISTVRIEEDLAFVDFVISYTAEMRDGDTTGIEGDGCLTFIRKHDHFWFINQFNFPGLYI